MKPENYEKIKRQRGGLKTGAAACRDQHENLMTDMQGMLGLWREHFDGLLNGDTNTDEVEPKSLDYYEVCIK